MTPLDAPWRCGKTERAGKDWKEDYYKMRQDGPEAQTWADIAEDCDAVNQARACKINGRGYNANQRVIGRNPPQMEDAILDCGGTDLGVTSRQQVREFNARKVGNNETDFTSNKLGPGLQASLENTLDNHLVLETRSKCSQETDEHFRARCSGQQIWPPPQICCPKRSLSGETLSRG